MYAIIEDSGTQIRVAQGDVIKIALRQLPDNSGKITIDRVLLVGGIEGTPAKVGAPLVSGAKVELEILSREKDDRVVIRKFRRRKNYRRHRGHRQEYLKVKVTSLTA
jgi:large subunit ribosomal protein L21